MHDILIRTGLLNPNTGTKLVKGIDGEDALLAAWRRFLPDVDMGVERLPFNESRCWPISQPPLIK